MRLAARSYALTASWDSVFEGVYAGYETISQAWESERKKQSPSGTFQIVAPEEPVLKA
jgi:hypothetical protein